MIVRDMWLTGLKGPSLHKLDSLATGGTGSEALRRQSNGYGRAGSHVNRGAVPGETVSL